MAPEENLEAEEDFLPGLLVKSLKVVEISPCVMDHGFRITRLASQDYGGGWPRSLVPHRFCHRFISCPRHTCGFHH